MGWLLFANCSSWRASKVPSPGLAAAGYTCWQAVVEEWQAGHAARAFASASNAPPTTRQLAATPWLSSRVPWFSTNPKSRPQSKTPHPAHSLTFVLTTATLLFCPCFARAPMQTPEGPVDRFLLLLHAACSNHHISQPLSLLFLSTPIHSHRPSTQRQDFDVCIFG